MEEIRSKINSIIVNALLVTSNDTGKFISQIYSKSRLESLVGTFLEEYIFEGFAHDTKGLYDFYSKSPKVCRKIINSGDEIYQCIECQSNGKCVTCYDCFLHSEHVNHDHKHWISNYTNTTCDCGVVESWKCHATCSKHMNVHETTDVFREAFLLKFRYIIEYLCELLKDIMSEDHSEIDNHMSAMLETYLRDKGPNTVPNIFKNRQLNIRNDSIDANARKSCLIVVFDGRQHLEEFTDWLKATLNMSAQDIQAARSDITEYGYTCVKYLSNLDECEKAKKSIEQYPRILSNHRTIKCSVSQVYRLFLMKLSPILISLMNKICFSNKLLCDILSELAFKKTSLANEYVRNEPVLWKNMREDIVIRIFMVVKYSHSGRIYASSLFLNNIRNLFTNFLLDQIEDTCIFLDVVDQIIYYPSVVSYLVENGFLCQMIDIFSNKLKGLGIQSGADIVKVYIIDNTKRQQLTRVLEMKKWICSCLRVSFVEIDVSAKFKSQLIDVGKTLLKFCIDFDDMEPSHKIGDVKISKEDYNCLVSMYGAIFLICSQLVKWIIYFEDIANDILKHFIEKFALDIQQIFKLNPNDQTTQKIVAYCNFEMGKVSLFNLSHRVFVDILMGCCMKGDLPREIKYKVLGDKNMLMWIARPAITALWSINNFIPITKGKNHINLENHIFVYRRSSLRYLYMQDLNTIQILISHLDPELCLNYMLFNISAPTQKLEDLLKPISSKLCSNELNVVNLRKFIFYVYNALVERHFVGISENPEYQLLERQVIHSIASGHHTIEEIRSNIFVYNETFVAPLSHDSFENILNMIIDKVSLKDYSYAANMRWLKPDYFNTVNVFYFTYFSPDRFAALNKLNEVFKTKKSRFQLPDILELRESFEGMNEFLYSDGLFDLIMCILTDWYTNMDQLRKGAVTNVIMITVILCFMLKISSNQPNHLRHIKTVDFIFGIQKDLGECNVLTLLTFLKKKINKQVYCSVVDHLIELSQIPINYFDDIPDNISDLVNKSQDCSDLAMKNLKNMYKEISKTKEELHEDKKFSSVDEADVTEKENI